MGNITMGFKKFLQNKNTVTIVGVVVAIFILYFAYNMRIKSAINPVTVPYASEQIKAGTQIKESMISTRQVPPSMLAGDVILNVGEIVDKYANVDTLIPKGSLFYKRAVVEREQLPDDIILDYPKDTVLYQHKVTVFSTYGNSILPDNYIDIYVSLTPDQEHRENVVVGKLLANVKVLAVKDSSGRPVFQNLEEKRTPDMLIFALPVEYFELLTAVERLKNTLGASITIVPTNESFKEEPGDIELSSEELKAKINGFVQYADDVKDTNTKKEAEDKDKK